jgi:hypothetical protein
MLAKKKPNSFVFCNNLFANRKKNLICLKGLGRYNFLPRVKKAK